VLLILIIGVAVVVAAAAIGEFFIVQRGLDLLPLTPSPSRRSGSRIAVVKNESPGLIESWDARRTALPRKLLTTSLRSDLRRGNGSDGLLWKCCGRVGPTSPPTK